MSELSEADRYLLDSVERGDGDGWSQLVKRYQGRLIAFARQRIRDNAEAKDLVQEVFLSFLKGVSRFRGQASLETYLFTILRRRIVDTLRGRRLHVCRLRDLADGDEVADAAARAAPDPTASWYARRDEQRDRQHGALSAALREVVAGYRTSLNFRELQIVEMLFYSQLRNKEVSRHAGTTENQVATIKHRCLKQIRKLAAHELGSGPTRGPTDDSDDCVGIASDALLTEVWEQQRPSCPKRSTIGAFLLGTLDPEWRDYVEFHLNTLGCRFCGANLDDLRHKTSEPQHQALRDKILQSTVGFFRVQS